MWWDPLGLPLEADTVAILVPGWADTLDKPQRFRKQREKQLQSGVVSSLNGRGSPTSSPGPSEQAAQSLGPLFSACEPQRFTELYLLLD